MVWTITVSTFHHTKLKKLVKIARNKSLLHITIKWNYHKPLQLLKQEDVFFLIRLKPCSLLYLYIYDFDKNCFVNLNKRIRVNNVTVITVIFIFLLWTVERCWIFIIFTISDIYGKTKQYYYYFQSTFTNTSLYNV
jgi:hypothetical protein